MELFENLRLHGITDSKFFFNSISYSVFQILILKQPTYRQRVLCDISIIELTLNVELNINYEYPPKPTLNNIVVRYPT